MSLLRYIILMIFSTAICWLALILVLIYVDPNQTGQVGFMLFYSSLFVTLTGTFALLGFFFRLIFFRQELIFQKVMIAFRQGISFAILLTGFTWLQSERLLSWYNVAFLILGLTVIEFFIITKKPNRIR